MDRFEEVFSIVYESVPLCLYRDKKTGLSIATAQVKAPTVNGYFALQTEVDNNFGLPHTLEHLVFLGSKEYPYKGVLDLLANRCMAQGTNAWTATDHTCYTIETAGSEGFYNILPVYLDHIIRPTLTDSGFITEVHHINGEGEDAGVVYCEMQSRENEREDRMDYASRQMLYPGDTGYKWETGGRLEDLRKLSNTQVRDFHKQMYTTRNSCIIVTGQVDMEALINAVLPVLDSLEPHHTVALPTRPFTTPILKLTKSVHEELTFPAENETSGASVWFSFHGPLWSDFETLDALDVLRTYLVQDAVSPLRRTFVEIETPFCGTVAAGSEDFAENTFAFNLEEVSVEQLRTKKDFAQEFLDAVGKDEIDMDRIRSILQQKRRRHLSTLESHPHDCFSSVLISEFLYGPSFGPAPEKGGMGLLKYLDVLGRYKEFESWTIEQWEELRRKWIMDNPHAMLVAVPSKKCGEEILKADEERMEKQKAELKPAGLAQKKKIAEKAEDDNDMETPDEILEMFDLPDPNKIKLIEVSTDRQVEPFVHWDRCAGAQFVSVEINLKLPDDPELLQYLTMWREVAFELPLKASDLGPAMEHEEVVRELTKLTVSQNASIGDGGRFSTDSWGLNYFLLEAKVEKEDVEEGVKWLHRILEDAIFDEERLKAGAARLENAIPSKKRKGPDLIHLCMSAIHVIDTTTSIPHLDFIRVEHLVKNFDAPKCIQSLNDLRKSFPSMVCRVAGDIDVTSLPWPKRRDGSYEDYVLWRHIAHPPIGGGLVVSTAAIESNFWSIMTAGPCSEPESLETEAALAIAIEVLVALEGPFWRKIRGKGLAYNYSMHYSSTRGTVNFSLFQTQNPGQAFDEAKKVVLGMTLAEMEDQDLEAARSGVCFGLISSVSTIPEAMDDNFENYACRCDPDRVPKLLELVMTVSEDAIYEALEMYIKPLFSGSVERSFALVCPETKVTEIQRYLSQNNFIFAHVNVDALEVLLSEPNGRALLRRRVHNLVSHQKMVEARENVLKQGRKTSDLTYSTKTTGGNSKSPAKKRHKRKTKDSVVIKDLPVDAVL
eukprot:GEMP01007794.1.p1 GENE.GEMP01007794.1~~GEMP01007794.1.p1  ORF type:complete len:1057 (+),score=253.87 GEMP01007794.1:32-3202(+)